MIYEENLLAPRSSSLRSNWKRVTGFILARCTRVFPGFVSDSLLHAATWKQALNTFSSILSARSILEFMLSSRVREERIPLKYSPRDLIDFQSTLLNYFTPTELEEHFSVKYRWDGPCLASRIKFKEIYEITIHGNRHFPIFNSWIKLALST